MADNIPPLDQVLDPRHELISSRRVEGASVYNAEGQKLGTIRSVMIMKQSGQVAYALVSLRGLPGSSTGIYPIPWQLLRYDVGRDGYFAQVSREQLEAGPAWALGAADRPRERSADEMLYSHYGLMPPWGGLP